jgi:integrase
MVDWKSRELHVPRTKNEEPLHVPLNEAAISALKMAFARDGTGRVFKSSKTGEPLENGRHWFHDAMVEAKLKNFHWHDLRHTFASRLRMKGTPLEDIADLLGHKSLTMTRGTRTWVRISSTRWCHCSSQVTPQVTPGKLTFRHPPRKLLCSNTIGA